jgi:hypothetical protein
MNLSAWPSSARAKSAEYDWYDDDSGGGLFGTNAQLEFTAPQSGRYYISVSDVYDEWSGGYILTVED